ncbi:MAG: hypothetical protein IKS48_09265 [Eubacterium sp.]|nr:hypothetical protein [Eubacterium sp.]
MSNKKFVLIMYMLFIAFLLGLARTLIFNVSVYGINKEPPAYEILFWGDERLIRAIDERFRNESVNVNLNISENENRSVQWDYFFQQGCFLNSFISGVAGYNESRLNLPRVSSSGTKSDNNNEASNVYDMGDGYLVNIIEERDNTELVHRISDFNISLKSRGIEYIFFLAPGKISRNDENELPFFLNNHSNKNADNLLELLEENGVYTYDLRDEFEKEENYKNFFYKNDHHWNNKAALLASSISAREICRIADLDYDASLYDINNYNYYEYKDRFYGSLIVDSSVWTEKDQKSDYVLYLPKFKTNISSSSVWDDYTDSESLEEAFCNWNQINDLGKDDETIYKSFAIGETGAIRNNLSNNNYKVLVLADSYAYSYVPYLCLQFDQIRRINLRSYQGSIYDYIDREKPDMVIQINDQDNNRYDTYNPEALWEFE